METQKYYLIETEDVGPNGGEHTREFAIQTEPCRTNMGNQPCTDGWLGTTNNIAAYARGEFASLEAAEAAIPDEFVQNPDAYLNDCIVSVWEKYISVWDAADWFQAENRTELAARYGITADSTDEDCLEASNRADEDASRECPDMETGYVHLTNSYKFFLQLRDELRD